MAAKATMRAYCQHCDATEVLAPEEIYSSEFNFWCPRCQSILILQDDGGGLAPLPHDEREAPTKEDDDEPPRALVIETRAEPEAPSHATAALGEPVVDAYSAFAEELDAGIAESERSRPVKRSGAFANIRDKRTERDLRPPGA